MERAMIAQSMRSHLESACPKQPVVDVRIGLGYTSATLEDGNVGLAYTFLQNANEGCTVFTGRRPLAGSTTTDLLEFLGSKDPVECAVGLAVANAMANRPTAGQEEGDVLQIVSVGTDDRVGMVGFFGPLVKPLEARARELVIFERDTNRSDRLRPAEQAFAELPACDIAVITSTALILGELENLLEAAAGCREVVLVGASTPLVPSVFRALGVTLLSGITVVDGSGIRQIISEGGGMKFFGERVRKVNVRL
jgi:uncharacterized protein (DUF4213/DUF364 family)